MLCADGISSGCLQVGVLMLLTTPNSTSSLWHFIRCVSRASDRSRSTAMNIMSTVWACQNALMKDIILSIVSKITFDKRHFLFPQVGMGTHGHLSTSRHTHAPPKYLANFTVARSTPHEITDLTICNMDTTPVACRSHGSIAISLLMPS